MYIPPVEGLTALAARQRGVVSRVQLRRLGVSYDRIDNELAAHRWSSQVPGVITLHNHVPGRAQWMWIALLDAGSNAALCSHTALAEHGMRAFAAEATFIHVVIPRGAKVHQLPLVQVHESRRIRSSDIQLVNGFPCTQAARSAVDAAAWQPWPRFAMTMMAATVQQRIATTSELDQALACCGRVRHKRYMRLALRDISGGAESLGEIDVAGMCRRFDLRQPDRQVMRRDPSGRRRYLDCEWELEDGTIVVLEIDGAHHLDVEHWAADMRRERKIVTSRRFVLRATAAEVRLDPGDVVADLRALGIPSVDPTCQKLTGL